MNIVAPDAGKPRHLLWRRFSIEVGLVVLLCVISVFTGVFLSNKRLIESEILSRAKAHFSGIVLTREWNARHGGVFVEKVPGVESNPYLANPDITTDAGVVYTKKNPALMTREISELATEKGFFRFHITSLRPLNPSNAPDAFETEALKSFEAGVREATVKTRMDGRTAFRYMAPLRVEQSCMQCHASQGYSVGEIRGGISVTFDIDEFEASIRRNGFITAILFAVTVAIMLGTIYLSVRRLRGRLVEAEGRLADMAITDELTGLRNRRFMTGKIEEEHRRSQRYGHPYAVIMCDLDHFKAVNDGFGHSGGDVVLQHVSRLLSDNCRKVDTPGRWGGEEFLIVLPETTENDAVLVAEKLRTRIAEQKFGLAADARMAVTASFGVAGCVGHGAESANEVVRRADDALYRAKAKGRNRVETDAGA